MPLRDKRIETDKNAIIAKYQNLKFIIAMEKEKFFNGRKILSENAAIYMCEKQQGGKTWKYFLS